MRRADESREFSSDEEFVDWLVAPDALPVFGVGPRVAILACLSESLALRGYSPTVSEMAEAIGLVHSTVHGHLVQLRAEGYVTWTDGEQRTLRFVGEGQR